ncbi:MAG: hypothetical protein AVO34_04865 [Firmicutes bacterium ML8_F2]|jgi:diguanylate cyclase (GGDEF)-like protein/PAS domain S-box-containing protein|nr:MAG: hypothetical protein AVO34_04865 [Firmicutes bacterium ML8_F2]
MDTGNDKHRRLIENLPDAFAYHQIVTDSEGKPVDYIFLDANLTFEKMTGLKKEDIIGMKVTEVLPGIERSDFDWIGNFGKTALTGETVHFEHYAEPLQRYYEGIAYAEEEQCFSVIFCDITDRIEKEERTKELSCLYSLSRLLSREQNRLEKIFEETVKLLPTSFQYPEKVSAAITFNGRRFTSHANLEQTPWKIAAPLQLHGEKIGTVEVYSHQLPSRGEDPFLPEEKLMLNTIAEYLNRVIEQIKAKEDLQESEEKLAITLNSIGDGVIATDAVGVVTRMNPQAEVLTGWTAEEALGRPLSEVFHIVSAQTGEPASNPVYRVIGTGKIEGLANDTTLIARDGTRRQIADSAAPIRDCEGKIFGVIMVFSDITEQYQAKEALRKSEERLDAILSNAPAVICSSKISEGSPVFTYVNANIVNVLGFEAEEILSQPQLWRERIHPQDVSAARAAVDDLLKGKEPVPLEYRFRHKAGDYLWLCEQQKLISKEREPEIISVCWDITERKRAERLIQARLNLFTLFRNNSFDAVLQKTLDEVCDIMDSPIGFYHFVSEDERHVTLKAWSTSTLEHFCKVGDLSGTQYSLDKAGVWVDCVRERGPVIHNDYASLPHRRGVPEGHAEIVRELVVPIKRQDRIVAILGVGNKPRDYTEQDVQVASYFADLTWSIAEQKQAEERIRYISFYDTLTGLYNRTFLEEEMQRLDTQRQLPISVVMIDLNGLKLVNDTYGHSLGDEMLKAVAGVLKHSCRAEDIIARWGGDEFVILLPQTSADKAESTCKRIKERCQGVYIKDVPVSLASGVAEKAETDTALPDILRAAEDNMYRQKLAESRSHRSAVLNALLKTLAAKSFETEEHTRRMQQVALRIGQKLGLPDSELSRLRLLIRLHDIGKINVSMEILTKKGPLTPDEEEMLKKHPETGYRITRATEEFSHVAEDILAHHEHWDGSGYPQGLKGKNIPLLARIVAIADAYDVMCNGRPYKEPMSKEETKEEFKRCAGTQFDPELVDIFLPLLEE